MDNILEFLQYYFPGIVACIAFGFFNLYNRIESKKVYRYFVWASLSVFFLILSEFAHEYYVALDHPTLGHVITSIFGYTFRPAIAFFTFLIPSRSISKKAKYINSIPLIVNEIVVCSALFCDLCFGYNEQNEFYRGPFGYIPFVVSGIYLFEIIVFCTLDVRKKAKMESVVSVSLCLLCVAATALESIMDMKGLLPSVCIVGIIFYYMYFFVNRYSRDQLTDAFLRNRLYDDLERVRGDAYFVMLDINGLKKINDTMGHSAGDAAITALSEAVFEAIDDNTSFYRMGGDEFALVINSDNEQEIKNLIEAVQSRLAESGLTMSYGYAPFSDGKQYERFSQVADAMMYENKHQFYLEHSELDRRDDTVNT